MIDVTNNAHANHTSKSGIAVASPPCSNTCQTSSMIDLNQLISYGASYRKVKPGEVIFMEGSELVYYFQLVTGSVSWINISSDGREFIQDIILPGESFGELPLFDDLPYAATAIANEESLLIRLPKAVFRQLLEDNPEIHFTFSKLMVTRIRFKFLMQREVAFHDPADRLQVLLNYFKNTGRHFCNQCNKVTLTRQQLADMTGLRVETVIRTIRTLQSKGLLTIQRGKVYY
jgi:CRP-like cAMP-binding protein